MGARSGNAVGGAALFREVNDRIYEIAQQLSRASRLSVDFVCECAEPGCSRRMSMTLDEYAAIRELPRHYAVAPDHEGDVSTAIRVRRGTYVVVERETVARR